MAMVGRLVPVGLWELFQRVVPAAPVRPQDGGRRRHGDREALAVILFVATTVVVAWLAGCRRLHRRYDRKTEHFLAFAGIAAALVCHRRLAA
nr:hypothetical protein [Streptomyces shenzhenensis]